jgi:hypothetical protein
LSFSQINRSIILTHHQQSRLKNIRDCDRKTKLLLKFIQKDSLRQTKELSDIAINRYEKHLNQIPGFRNIKEMKNDVIQISEIGSEDNSAKTISHNVKATGNLFQINEIEQAKNNLESYTGDLKNLTQVLDAPEDIVKLEDNMQNEIVRHSDLSKVTSQQRDINSAFSFEEISRAKDPESQRQTLLKKANSFAADYIADHSEQLQQAQAKLAKLKRKYSNILSTNDLTDATKKNSLKGKSLLERITLSGNFQVVNTDPFSIDITPSLGYKFSGSIEAGLNGVYRFAFGHSDVKSTISENAIGGSLFASYEVKNGFLAYFEFEKMNIEIMNGPIDKGTRIWTTGFHAGVGRNLDYSKHFQAQIRVLYNFTHREQVTVYPGKVLVKFGFKLKKFPFKNND